MNKINFLLVAFLAAIVHLFTVSSIHANSLPNNSVFKKISLTTAKEMAASQGKMIFIEFYADWCVPCKWMEETTLADPEVVSCLDKDYIALRVDIDDFDGFAVKEQFGIKVLPTLMIIDEQGLTVERKEQSMSAEMLLKMLKSKKSNTFQAPANSSPSNIKITEEKKQDIVELPVLKPENIANHATVETKAYRVQVGVFTDYANTQNLVEKLRSLTKEPIVVLNDRMHQKTVFKVLVGDFIKKQKAINFKNELWQNYGIDGYVK